MGCLGSKDATDFFVYVRTGDRKGAGTDANVTIVLYDENGGKSKEYPLDNFFRNDFESGSLDTFSVKNLKHFDSVSKIEFWRDTSGLGDAWYVDRVMVESKSTKTMYVFPVYRWIKPGHHYVINHLDTSLPQFDDQMDQRKMELTDKKDLYQISTRSKGFPAQVYIYIYIGVIGGQRTESSGIPAERYN